MAWSYDNTHAQTHERFLDVDQELRKMLQPIEGYQHLPLVSLEEAVEPIISSCPDIRRRVYIAKENCENLPSNIRNRQNSIDLSLYNGMTTKIGMSLYGNEYCPSS